MNLTMRVAGGVEGNGVGSESDRSPRWSLSGKWE